MANVRIDSLSALPAKYIRGNMLDMASRAVKKQTNYECLEVHPGSFYQEFFLRGANLGCSRLVGWMKAEHLTPEQAAADRSLPLEAVLQAIDYVKNNKDVIAKDLEREHRLLRDRGLLEASDA